MCKHSKTGFLKFLLYNLVAILGYFDTEIKPFLRDYFVQRKKEPSTAQVYKSTPGPCPGLPLDHPLGPLELWLGVSGAVWGGRGGGTQAPERP